MTITHVLLNQLLFAAMVAGWAALVYVFIRSKNGKLKWYMIGLFSALVIGSSQRALTETLLTYLTQEWINTTVAVPIIIAQFFVMKFVVKTYW